MDEGIAKLTEAIGLVAVQADCTCGEALGLMKARALLFDQHLEQLSTAVLDGAIRFGLFGPRNGQMLNLRPVRDVWDEALEAICAA